MSVELIFFIAFLVIIVGLLLLDLGVFDKENHIVSFKSALFYTFLWIALSLGFYVLILYHADWIHLGPDGTLEELKALIVRFEHPINIDGLDYQSALKVYEKNLALEYLTGYVIEWMLSLDNIFVMVVIFFAFKVNPLYYRRVLFYGILAAVVFRFLFIFTASALITKFHWILYIFGILLIFTGIKMFFEKGQTKIDTKRHPAVRFASKYLPVYPEFVREHFFVRKAGKLMITPLFITLMVIEFSDVVFAVDSIPAIFAVTKDPYIIFFSNVFAILGLRSMFFVLIRVINVFRYLKTGLAFLMTFIGFKMMFSEWLKEIGFTTAYSLYVILVIMVLSILLSLIIPDKRKQEAEG
jgi:tellurite resistance protein TerC